MPTSRKDPVCHTTTRGDAIHDFLKHTDFGEIREMVEGSDPCILKTIEAFNEQLWKYPAKVGTLVATVIPLMNTLMRVLREILVPIEKAVGPDLLADIILSVIRGINGTDAAKLTNSLQEAVRRVHTGSLLLGKGGKPLFQIYLTDLLQDCMTEMDPVLLKKVRIVFAEDREAIANAMADGLSDNPEITRILPGIHGPGEDLGHQGKIPQTGRHRGDGPSRALNLPYPRACRTSIPMRSPGS